MRTSLLPALGCLALVVTFGPVLPIQAEAPAVSVSPTKGAATADWPRWRGPTGNGIAAPDQQPPLTWSDTEHVLWTSPIPGRGFGSPTVFGQRVFLAAAEPDNQVQSVLCFHRATGKQLWKTAVHEGNFET